MRPRTVAGCADAGMPRMQPVGPDANYPSRDTTVAHERRAWAGARMSNGKLNGAAFGALATLVLLALAVPASAESTLTRVSADRSTTTGTQHATEVEPDTFAFGST